jgi:hypothetical protein
VISTRERWFPGHLNARPILIRPVQVLLLLSLAFPALSLAQVASLPDAPTVPSDSAARTAEPAKGNGVATSADMGSISGTVTDYDDAIIPGASILLEGPGAGESQTAVADGSGAFLFTGIEPGGPYRVTITADGFAPWTSSVMVEPSHFVFVSDIKMRLSGGVTSVRVDGSSAEIATQQVALAEKQRVLGVIPNFYVVYDAHPEPLTAKLKFSLAWKAETDPVVFLGAAFVAGMQQAGGTPDYQQGLKGYGQRLGANYATGFADIMIGGAILPSLLHQDPRYFYQGTGTTRSRVVHALSSPFICKGDNGNWQPNYSSLGGDLAASAIANTYYPASDRGAGVAAQSFLITTSGRMVNSIIQEFVLRKLTPAARN